MEQLSSLYEKWIETPRWQKWILILFLGALLLGLLYYYKIVPLQQELARKRAQADTLALTVSRLKVFEKRRAAVQKEINQLEKQIAAIEKKLPTGNEEVSQILKSITGADSGMVIRFIKRDKPHSSKYYVAYPYTVQLAGTYPNFVRWCERLSKVDRILNFGDISIVSYKKKPSGLPRKGEEERSPGYTVVATLKIKAFTLKR
ncbi:type 4a pilus biogenesis protein PilO [Thermovibrio ammonificans]